MTAAEQSQVDAIERDRHKREAELLLLLLLTFGKASRYATAAIRLGHDPGAAARSVIVGNAALDLPGIVPAASKILATSYIDGMRRAARVAGKVPNATAAEIPPELLDVQTTVAARMADGMARTFAERISDAVADAQQAGFGPIKTAQTVRSAIADGGYTEANPFLLEAVAEVQIVNANGAGQWNNWHDPQIAADLVGFKHVSVLDAGTTAICRARAGFQRPKDDPYWQTNWPALHFGCRSVILPLFHEADWTAELPTIPPAPGFGWAMSPLRNVAI